MKFTKFLIISALVVMLGVGLFSARQASALDGPDIVGQLGAAGTGAGYTPADVKDPRQIVANIIRVALEFLGMLFFVFTLYAGFLWMTAGGNDEQVTKAKSLLTQAVIGLAIILSAYSITLFAIKLAKGDYTDYWDGQIRRYDLEKAPIYDSDASGVPVGEVNLLRR
ncbi:MAG: hypothetical protein A3J93_02455 [Candidatus Magasanikbacteria bacterium RIFOXYC2_FULL_42_28]|uniref:Uncharacterized protein n=1 Tax=Candidatus Magasanikbacteria bacterium RIFOXYC2_FULL_42_28 TaxID=1798704 RepID=A0A1F6NVR2_9BACT|nr:MAG: hypothetical protein A3J93_02455 [Candidatus Magasanikbacteria bacterium RIFOXYC2_FULL_42_28]